MFASGNVGVGILVYMISWAGYRIAVYFINVYDYRISSVIRQSFFPSKTIPKNLDPSYNMDLDLWDCFGRKKNVCPQRGTASSVNKIKIMKFS